MKRRGVWITVLVAAAIWAYVRFKSPLSLSDAAERYVNVELSADNAAHCSARVALRPGGPKDLTISIPAGTFILNSDPGSQVLMTAKGATIHLTQDQPSISVTMETYCVNQFAAEPMRTSSLTLAPHAAASVATARAVGGSSSAGGSFQEVTESVTVETEPLRKLAACLEKSSESRETRQLAVWLVSGQHLDMNYTGVYERLRDQYLRSMTVQMRAKLDEARSELLRNDPGLTEDQASAAIQRYTRNQLDQDLVTEAKKRAQKDVDAFATAGRRLLAACDSRIDDKYFFRTAAWRR